MVIPVVTGSNVDRMSYPKHYPGGKQVSFMYILISCVEICDQDPELLCMEISERITTLEKASALQTTDMVGNQTSISGIPLHCYKS